MAIDAAAEETFGPYLVYERLGVGGMATVHRALERNEAGLERVVALKRLLPHLAEDASFIKGFVREAKLASLLDHINIVQIYELGRVGTAYFITMEYIEGRDMRSVLRHARKVTGPPPISVTVGLMLQLCDALDYAHNKVDDHGEPLRLVHRDVSPSNLLVTKSGYLKIIDFGIAKAESAQLRTQTGRVKGKLAYMAPEAISGSKDLDARSDLWACGVILHELLTARPLFASKNEYQTLLKVQRGDIMPPSTFNQTCPPELDAIVFKALARDPEQRFPNAASMRAELTALKQQYGLQTGHRDVATWLDWALAMAGTVAGVTDLNDSGVISLDEPPRTPLPPPQGSEDEEAVEVAWGGGDREAAQGPIALADVPDVSDKLGAPRSDTEAEDRFRDDIPTPLPQHGTMPSIYGEDHGVLGAAPATEPSIPPVTFEPALARGTDLPVARGSDRLPTARARVSDKLPAVGKPRTSEVATVRPARPSDRQPVIEPARPTGDTGAEPAAEPRRRAARSTVDVPNVSDRIAQLGLEADLGGGPRHARADSVAITNPEARPLPDPAPSGLDEAALFGDEAAQTLAGIARQAASRTPPAPTPILDSAPPEPPAVPVVRFSKSMTTPPVTRAHGTTRPGIGPAAAPSSPSKPLSAQRPAVDTPAAPAPVVRRRARWPLVVVGVLLVGGAAAAGAYVVLAKRGPAVLAPATPSPPAGPEVGSVRFVTEPADAEIKIADQHAHVGSPWSTELAAGIHQIEIHKDGYKSWVTSLELSAGELQTLRVVLEPMPEVETAATLTINTDPAGLEVVLDGTLLPDKTPIKTSLPVGPHQIVVRKDGADVWTQQLTAEASSDYEFNPSFTAAKQRERAERATTPRAAPRPAPRPAAEEPASSETSTARPLEPSPPAPRLTPPGAPPAIHGP
jgi:eukaryotic-like serine/threonine-protein kinase